MANPQLENGYTRIANEIIEMLCLCGLKKSEWKVLLFILRKTYGWGKQEDMISISQFEDATGLSRRTVIYALQDLEAKKMITIERKKEGRMKNEINRISFQKDYDLWSVEAKAPQYQKVIDYGKAIYKKSKEKSASSAKKRELVVQETEKKGGLFAPTKETITKETTKEIYSPNSDEFKLSELLLNLILKRNPMNKVPDLQRWALQVNRMIRLDSRKADDIEAVIEWCQANEFWQNNVLSTEKLRQKFDQLYLKMEAENAKHKTGNKFTGLSKKNYNEGAF